VQLQSAAMIASTDEALMTLRQSMKNDAVGVGAGAGGERGLLGNGWAAAATAWQQHSTNHQRRSLAYLSELATTHSAIALQCASLGDDRNATHHHLVMLRATQAAWEERRAQATADGSTPPHPAWWTTTPALMAVQCILAAQVMPSLRSGAPTYPPSPLPPPTQSTLHTEEGLDGGVKTVDVGSNAHTVLASGYPLYRYQRDAFDKIMPAQLTPSIDRVDADISATDLCVPSSPLALA
jgi:hypothetical protein